VRTPPWRVACRCPSGPDGSARVAECRHFLSQFPPAATCHSRNARRWRCSRPRSAGSERSPAGCAGIRRRCHASCAATPPPEAASWSTEPRPRNGMPNNGPAARRRPSSPRTRPCATTSRNGSQGWSPTTTDVASPALTCHGRAADTDAGHTAAGAGRGARSRSLGGCRWTSPTMSPCGSRTRRSTSPSTCKDAARCAVSSPHVYAPAEHCGYHELGPGRGERSS
jgi:hypothetical protein